MNNFMVLRWTASPCSLVTDISMGQFETKFFIIGLLVSHSVKSDISPPKGFYAMIPDFESISLSPKGRKNDIKTEECKRFTIFNSRKAGNGFIVQQPHKKPGRVGVKIAVCIKKPGVPAFLGCPFNRPIQFTTGHCPDGICVV